MFPFVRRLAACVLLASPTASACPPETQAVEEKQPDPIYYLDALFRPGDDLSTLVITQYLATDPWQRDDIVQLGRQQADAVLAKASDDPWIAAHAVAQVVDVAGRARWRTALGRGARDNGYFALLLMAQDDIRADPGAVAAWIRVAADAPSFRSAYAQELGPMAARLAVASGPDDLEAQSTAFETAMTLVASAAPPIAPWWDACKKAIGDARRDCRAFATRLAGSDALIYALFGARLLELTADDDAARRAARERWRELHWLMHHSPRILAGPEWTAGDRAFIAALSTEGEVAAIRAFLVANGEPTMPPADFVLPEPPAIK